MIREIEIENYKSIKKIQVNLGRFNVFIGENGAGKSNLLEAIALAGATQARKLDNEFLSSRGIRVTHPQWMRNAFTKDNTIEPIKIKATEEHGETLIFDIKSDDSPYPQWQAKIQDNVRAKISKPSDMLEFIKTFQKDSSNKDETEEVIKILVDYLKNPQNIKTTYHKEKESTEIEINLETPSPFLDIAKNRQDNIFRSLSDFIIYSPENSALRNFEKEGQIEPLGINGEGLLKLLSVFEAENNKTILDSIKRSLKVLGWFKDFNMVFTSTSNQSRMEISDRWIDNDLNCFDQKSANEGFLFLVFYFSLFSTKLTPSFFAIDNIDASLNPKLCQKLITQLYKLSCENDKQVLLTTHNPAILDGLNLDDPEQRLFVISRGNRGDTRIRRIKKDEQIEGIKPSKLSESFLRGSLGGLPKGF